MIGYYSGDFQMAGDWLKVIISFYLKRWPKFHLWLSDIYTRNNFCSCSWNKLNFACWFCLPGESSNYVSISFYFNINIYPVCYLKYETPLWSHSYLHHPWSCHNSFLILIFKILKTLKWKCIIFTFNTYLCIPKDM